jgi:hypothetical protein
VEIVVQDTGFPLAIGDSISVIEGVIQVSGSWEVTR